MKRILFLCHGNICRSPMAEYIFKAKIKDRKLEDKYEVSSKALSYEEIGNDIYPFAKDCLRRHNVPFSKHSASHFDKEDYDLFDEIYVMDNSNLNRISRITNDPENKIRLLNGNIEDPWYTDNFDLVYQLIDKGIDDILEREN